MSTTQHGLSQEELDALTPEERAAVTAELSDEEAALERGGPGVVDAGADPLKDAPKTELEPDDPDDPAKPAEGAAGEPAAEEPFVVPFSAPEIDDEKVKVEREKIEAAAKAQLDDVMKQYDDGDINQEEMLAKRDAINADKAQRNSQIDFAIHEAELAAKHETQVEFRVWKRDVDAFLSDHEAYKEPVLKTALDNEVKRLANLKDERGELLHDNLPNRKLLDMAHGNVAKHFKVGGAPVKDPVKDPVKEARDKRIPDLSNVPRTLHDAPAAAAHNADIDEFASLDALQARAEGGDNEAQAAYERAIAHMERTNPAAAERYLRATA